MKSESINKLETAAIKVENELAKVQVAFFKYEASDMPKLYQKLGFDNIVNNVCFYDIIGAVMANDKILADKMQKETKVYLQDCLGSLEANKPICGGWYGFEAEAYYSLHTAMSFYNYEFIDAYNQVWAN